MVFALSEEDGPACCFSVGWFHGFLWCGVVHGLGVGGECLTDVLLLSIVFS